MGQNTETFLISRQKTLLASALEYASRGWAVFPVLPDLDGTAETKTGRRSSSVKVKLTHSGWERWATTDSTRIARTWTRHPWGIGIACGLSNLVVIDSEPDAQGNLPGEIELHRLATNFGALPATWTVSTGDGGVSRYFQAHPSLSLHPTPLGANLRIRGGADYTIAPPTTTTSGTWYLLQNQPVAPLPLWMIQLLQS